MLDDVNHCNVSRSDFPTFIPSHVPCEFHVNSMIKGGNRKHVIVKEPWSVLEQIQVVSADMEAMLTAMQRDEGLTAQPLASGSAKIKLHGNSGLLWLKQRATPGFSVI
mmetsp:Transcript_48510/g.136192  ORF Transcript_48510/g.136192 Transcript_48510/m.136192 type:complete len:108 (-) Transcript_48510:4284-4607(-)